MCLRLRENHAFLTRSELSWLSSPHDADCTSVGRRCKAWLVNGNGKRAVKGKQLRGYAFAWQEYYADGRYKHRAKTFEMMAAKWPVQEQAEYRDSSAWINACRAACMFGAGHNGLLEFQFERSRRARWGEEPSRDRSVRARPR